MGERAQIQRWQRHLRGVRAAQEAAAQQIGMVVHVDPGENVLQGAQYPPAEWRGNRPGDWLCPCRYTVFAGRMQCPQCQRPRSSCLAVEPLRRGQRWCADCASFFRSQVEGTCPKCRKPGQKVLPYEPAAGVEPPGPSLEIPDDYRTNAQLVRWLRALLHGDNCLVPSFVWPRIYFIRQDGHEVRAVRCREVGAAWNYTQQHVEDVLRNAQRNGERFFAHVWIDGEWAVVSMERPGKPHRWDSLDPDGHGPGSSGDTCLHGQGQHAGLGPGQPAGDECPAQEETRGGCQHGGCQFGDQPSWSEASPNPHGTVQPWPPSEHEEPQGPAGPEPTPGSWSVPCPDGLYVCSVCQCVQLGSYLPRNLTGTDFRCPLCYDKRKDGVYQHLDSFRAMGEAGVRIAEEAARRWEAHMAARAEAEERVRAHEERSRAEAASAERRKEFDRGGPWAVHRAPGAQYGGAESAQAAKAGPANAAQHSHHEGGHGPYAPQVEHSAKGLDASECAGAGRGFDAGPRAKPADQMPGHWNIPEGPAEGMVPRPPSLGRNSQAPPPSPYLESDDDLPDWDALGPEEQRRLAQAGPVRRADGSLRPVARKAPPRRPEGTKGPPSKAPCSSVDCTPAGGPFLAAAGKPTGPPPPRGTLEARPGGERLEPAARGRSPGQSPGRRKRWAGQSAERLEDSEDPSEGPKNPERMLALSLPKRGTQAVRAGEPVTPGRRAAQQALLDSYMDLVMPAVFRECSAKAPPACMVPAGAADQIAARFAQLGAAQQLALQMEAEAPPGAGGSSQLSLPAAAGRRSVAPLAKAYFEQVAAGPGRPGIADVALAALPDVDAADDREATSP